MNKIIVVSNAGLANRMFQYAFYISLHNKYQNVYYDDCSYKAQLAHENVKIDSIFQNIKIERVTHGFSLAYTSSFLGKIMRKILSFLNYRYYVNWSLSYDASVINKTFINRCIIGIWQNENYFKDVESVIRKSYVFPPLCDVRNIQLTHELKESESVSIHIRKGKDYQNLPEFKGTCSLEYYYKAIDLIREKIPNAKFYVFTDNPEWVKNNLNYIEYKTIDWNPSKGVGNHIDMQLMSLCKHNIIANSTYSWWGAWLNCNKSKIVIAPKVWFNPINKRYSNYNIVPDEWIVL